MGAALIRCVVGDGSEVYLEGLEAVLARAAVDVVGRALTPEEMVDEVRRVRPDAAVAAFDPPAEAIAVAGLVAPVPVLVLAWSTLEADLVAALRAGAQGYLGKGARAQELAAALGRVSRGRSVFPAGWERVVVGMVDRRAGGHLTARELEIVRLVVEGCSNKEIARRLGIAPQTAKNHLRNMMAKIDVKSRLQLSHWATGRGLAPSSGSTWLRGA